MLFSSAPVNSDNHIFGRCSAAAGILSTCPCDLSPPTRNQITILCYSELASGCCCSSTPCRFVVVLAPLNDDCCLPNLPSSIATRILPYYDANLPGCIPSTTNRLHAFCIRPDCSSQCCTSTTLPG